MSKHLLVPILFLILSLITIHCKEENVNNKDTESTDSSGSSSSWWSGFKSRVKSVLSRWQEDLKVLWSDVLAKAEDMRGWTAEVFESFKVKMKEFVESRKEVPDDEKNEIEDFISKLKVPTEKTPTKKIDP